MILRMVEGVLEKGNDLRRMVNDLPGMVNDLPRMVYVT